MASNLSIQISDDFQKEFEVMIQELARKVIDEVSHDPLGKKMYLNKREACVYLGVSFVTLQKLIMMGCPVIQIDNKHLLSKASIDSFMLTLENK